MNDFGMTQHHVGDVWATVKVDDNALSDGWDGDHELDPARSWTPYQLMLWRETEQGPELLDSIGAVWASNDDEGQVYVEESIDMYLLDDADGALPKLDALEITYV